MEEDTLFHHLRASILDIQRELYWLQKRRLDDDMLQQGELGVVRREKEGTSGVHLDSKVGRVKGCTCA